jgi:hypothetical protein
MKPKDEEELLDAFEYINNNAEQNLSDWFKQQKSLEKTKAVDSVSGYLEDDGED